MLKKPFVNLDDIESNFVKLYGENSPFQKQRYINAFSKFKEIYSEDKSYIASSSGRVEVCGNHTDHNGGKVVSCAISLDTLAFFLPTDNNVVSIVSEGHGEMTVDLNGEEIEKIGTSAALVRGVAVGLKDRNYKVGGFKAYITSSVLGGAGISSSASFEVLIAEIFNFLYNDGVISCEEKAVVSQFAENKYFGKPCGLLDQTAISFGGLNKLDFSNKQKISVSKINCDLNGFTFVLINTGGSHADLTDEYASIPYEMKKVAKAFGKERLIDITKEEFLDGLKDKLTQLTDREVLRALHFYNENERVDKLATALENSDYVTFLKCIKASGISSMVKLQNCYVSGSTEQPIPKALSIAEEYLIEGANRVHGGGFAGTILNVIKNGDSAKEFISKMQDIFGVENVIPLKVRSIGTITL